MSKKLYDACRAYKHFYKKQKDVEAWNRKYHDIDLSSQIRLVNSQVRIVEERLLKQLFKEFDVKVQTMDIETEMPCDDWRFGVKNYMNLVSEAEVSFRDSKRFLNVLSEYMMNKKYRFPK